MIMMAMMMMMMIIVIVKEVVFKILQTEQKLVRGVVFSQSRLTCDSLSCRDFGSL